MHYVKNTKTNETLSLSDAKYERFFDNRDPFEWEEDLINLDVKAIELAEMLDGGDYRDEVSTILRKWACDNDLVIVHGASDDLTIFDGCWYDEAGLGKIYVDMKGPVPYIDCNCEWADAAKEAQELLPFIKAKWHNGPVPMTYETEIPHAEFKIFEDEDDIYCIGIVFSLKDLEKIIKKN